MPIDHATLRTEIRTGSFASLYSAAMLLGDYNTMVDTINTRGLTASTIAIGTANATTMQQCVVAAEFAALTQAQRDLWQCIVTTAVTGVAISNAAIRAQVVAIWSAGTTTRANLVTAQSRLCSRAETLFGENVVVDALALYVAATQP